MASLSRADQREASRVLLLDVSLDLLTRHGYDRTSVAMICEAAGVTHGALYHHFGSKLELFDQVVQHVTNSAADAIARHVEARTGWDRLVGALDAYLDQYSRPDVKAVLLDDGPRVLGRERFDEIDRAANEPLLSGLLRGAVDEGVLAIGDVAIANQVMAGALEKAAWTLAIARDDDKQRVRGELNALLLAWFEALRKASV